MKKAAILIMALLPWLNSGGQQLPMYSQYVSNLYLLDPAVAGSTNFTSLKFCSRQQWVGIPGAPSTQVISMFARIGRSDFYDRTGKVAETTKIEGTDVVKNKSFMFTGRDAIGAIVFNDRNGPITRTGVEFTYAYHIPFYQYMNRFNKPAQLAFGISATVFQQVIDETQLTLYDANDPVISGAREASLIPDANFGMLFYNTNYYMGCSVLDIFQSSMRLRDSHISENDMVRHYYMVGGYKYEMTNDMMIEPSALIKFTEITPIQVELTTMIRLKTISFGLSYRSNNDFIGLFETKVGRYSFGYSFDYSFGNIITYSSGTHEVVIGINIGESATAGIWDKNN